MSGMGLRCAAVLMTLFVAAGMAHADSVLSSGTVRTGLTTGWANPDFILAGDTSLAVFTGGTQTASTVTAFGFSLPGNATVSGIEVLVTGYAASTVGNRAKYFVTLTKDGSTAVTADYTGTFVASPGSTISTGTATDLWGASWSYSDINSPNFGVIVRDADAATTQALDFDWVGVMVYYTLPSPASPGVSSVYLSSVSVSWTQVGSLAGYIVEASTSQQFTGPTLTSSTTPNGTNNDLTVPDLPQLSSNTVYNIRVGSLWGNSTSYAATLTTATLANIVENPAVYGVFMSSITVNWLPRPEAPLEDSCSGYILQADDDINFGSPVSSVTTQGPTAVTTLTVTGLGGNTQYYLRYGALNTTHFVPNYYSTGAVVTTQLGFVDCGLNYYDGATVVTFACEAPGSVTSRLQIYKAPDVYGIVLVDVADPNASKMNVWTPDGLKAIRKYP